MAIATRAPAGLLALLIRLVVLVQLGGHSLLQPTGVLDDAVYVQMAQRVASGDLGLGPEVYFLSPFYSYFLGLIFAMTGGSIAAARVVQVLLGAVAVGLIGRTAEAWFGRRAGVLSAVLAAVTGVFAFNEILILQSSIDVFLTSLALFALTRALQSGSWRTFAGAGVAFGALALNRPNALVALAAVPMVWLLQRRTRAAALQAAALVAGAALLIAPVALRNRIVAGDAVLITSHGGLNFFIGNHAGADGTWSGVEGISPSIAGQATDARRVAAKAVGHDVTASEASDYYYRLAWQWIREHPGDWLVLMARKIALVLTATDVALNYSYSYFSRDESSLLSGLLIGPWLLIPFGVLGLGQRLVRAGDRPAYLSWLVVAPAYALAVAVFFVSSRYRLPLLVPMLAGAGSGLLWCWDAVRSPSVRRIAAGGTSLLALLVFVNWPLVEDAGRMYERGERIVQLFDSGQAADAERLLADTLPHYPEPALLLYRVGLVFRQHHDAVGAVAFLERARAADSSEPRIRFNLGEALIEAGRPADALPHLEAAQAAGIDPATVAYDLVGAYRATGRDDRARAALASIVITPGMNGTALVELGDAGLALQDPQLAIRYLKVAASREPSLAAAHASLGSALAATGDMKGAVAELTEAVRLDPASRDARSLLEKLRIR